MKKRKNPRKEKKARRRCLLAKKRQETAEEKTTSKPPPFFTKIYTTLPRNSPDPHEEGLPRMWRYEDKRSFLTRRDKDLKPLYAALDLGTNNCRLLVAYPQGPGYFGILDSFSRVVCLGEGIERTGMLTESAISRTIKALKICRRKLDKRALKGTRLIATQACRIAANQKEFIQRAHEESGIELEILTQEKEAYFCVAGCASLLQDRDISGVLIFDIGGGSSELIWLDMRNRHHERGLALTRFIRNWISVETGVVTLSEKFKKRPPSPLVFQDMVEFVTDLLPEFAEEDALREQLRLGNIHMLGASGATTALAALYLGMPKYYPRRVNGIWLEAPVADQLIHQISHMTFDEIRTHPQISVRRPEYMLSGCAILEAFRRKWPCERIRVADRGLRDGMLIEMMTNDRVWSRKP